MHTIKRKTYAIYFFTYLFLDQVFPLIFDISIYNFIIKVLLPFTIGSFKGDEYNTSWILYLAVYLTPLYLIYYFTVGRLRDMGWDWKWVFIAYLDFPILLGVITGIITDVKILYYFFFIKIIFNLFLLLWKSKDDK